MKRLFLLFLLPAVFICNTAMGQNKSSTQDGGKVFNIPPGSVVMRKVNTDLDYSYKLADIPSNEPHVQPEDFLKHLQKDELAEMEATAPESYRYYMDAKQFYTSLSNKVKATFSVDELWHIYMFDQKLKTTLENIK